jgi:hypothetical protein
VDVAVTSTHLYWTTPFNQCTTLRVQKLSIAQLVKGYASPKEIAAEHARLLEPIERGRVQAAERAIVTLRAGRRMARGARRLNETRLR